MWKSDSLLRRREGLHCADLIPSWACTPLAHLENKFLYWGRVENVESLAEFLRIVTLSYERRFVQSREKGYHWLMVDLGWGWIKFSSLNQKWVMHHFFLSSTLPILSTKEAIGMYLGTYWELLPILSKAGLEFHLVLQIIHQFFMGLDSSRGGTVV